MRRTTTSSKGRTQFELVPDGGWSWGNRLIISPFYREQGERNRPDIIQSKLDKGAESIGTPTPFRQV